MLKTLGRLASGWIVLTLLAAPAAAQDPPSAPQPATAPPPASTATPAPAATQKPAAMPPGAWKAPASKLPKLPPPPPPPDTPARLWIIAPGPKETWTMRIDNEGDRAIRVPADVRLLSFEVEVPSNDPKNPKKKPAVYKCAAPDSLRPTAFPEKRALLLAPGQSYIETFDPRLFCFGKNAAALVGSATVRTRFGWEPPPKWSLAAKKAPAGPFAAEGTDNPATTMPLKQLRAPTMVLSYGTPAPAPAAPAQATPSPAPAAPSPAQPAPSPAQPAPAPAPVDQNAPRLAVETPAYADASAPRSASVTVTVKNAGGRPMTAALRARMVSLEVVGPDRTVVCPASLPANAIPREGYREYKPGGSTSFTLLIEEACSDRVFSRPGLYHLRAGIHANETGADLGVDGFTGKAIAAEPTLMRLQSAREPFYRDPPKAVPTPKPEVPADEADPAP